MGQLGLDTYMSLLKKANRNSNPTLRAPAPDKVWIVAILSSLTMGESSPNTRVLVPLMKSWCPSILRYS